MFALNVGNAARNREQVLKPVTVTKVGRKFFTVQWEGSTCTATFHLDTWREKSLYTPNVALCLTEQTWLDEKEKRELLVFARESFSSYGPTQLTLAQLRAVAAVLKQPAGQPTPEQVLRTALQELLDAMDRADKQWIGLNMVVPGQKNAHDILMAGRIQAVRALQSTVVKA